MNKIKLFWRYGVLAVIMLSLMAIVVYGADLYAPTGKEMARVTFAPERDTIVCINAQTAPGDAAAVDLGFHVKSQGCTVTLGGTAPTSVTISGKRSTDGASGTYATLFIHTYTVATADTQGFDIDYVGRYWKFSYDSKVGGAADTAVTLKCDIKE